MSTNWRQKSKSALTFNSCVFIGDDLDTRILRHKEQNTLNLSCLLIVSRIHLQQEKNTNNTTPLIKTDGHVLVSEAVYSLMENFLHFHNVTIEDLVALEKL